MQDLLSQTSLFRDMPIDVYHVLLELIHTRTYQANEHILSDGDPSPDLFVVLRGKVLVEERVLLAGAPYRPSMTSSPFLQATPPPTRSKLMTTVRKVGEGAVFGLSSLVDFEWSHSAVQAETDVEVACLSSADVDWVFRVRASPWPARDRRLLTGLLSSHSAPQSWHESAGWQLCSGRDLGRYEPYRGPCSEGAAHLACCDARQSSTTPP